MTQAVDFAIASPFDVLADELDQYWQKFMTAYAVARGSERAELRTLYYRECRAIANKHGWDYDDFIAARERRTNEHMPPDYTEEVW